jgi:hypothetical protein
VMVIPSFVHYTLPEYLIRPLSLDKGLLAIN